MVNFLQMQCCWLDDVPQTQRLTGGAVVALGGLLRMDIAGGANGARVAVQPTRNLFDDVQDQPQYLLNVDVSVQMYPYTIAVSVTLHQLYRLLLLLASRRAGALKIQYELQRRCHDRAQNAALCAIVPVHRIVVFVAAVAVVAARVSMQSYS